MRVTVWKVLPTVVLLSCYAPTELQLDEAADPDPSWEARRRRMDITVRPGAPGDWSDDLEVMTQEDFRTDVLLPHCYSTISTAAPFNNATDGSCSALSAVAPVPDACIIDACLVQLYLCSAHTLMELSRAVAPLVLEGAATSYLVPPQSTATNAGFNEWAQRLATVAVHRAGENLRFATDPAYEPNNDPLEPHVPACSSGGLNIEITELHGDPPVVLQNFGELFAGALIEGTQLAHQAARHGMEDNVAIADADLSAGPNRGLASRTAWTAPVLSRMHATQLLTGGDECETGGPCPQHRVQISQSGICATPCTTNCRTLVDTMRASGMSPEDLLNPGIDNDDIIVGDNLITNGGLRERLAERWQMPDLSTAPPEDFLARLGVSQADMSVARQFLRDETLAFDRDPTQLAPRPILVTSNQDAAPVESQYDYYAATVSRPQPLPGVFHIAMARGNQETHEHRVVGTTQTLPAPSMSAYPSLASLSNGGISQLADYAQSVAYFVIDSGALGPVVQDTLGVLLAQRELSDTLRVEHCYRYDDSRHQLRVRVFGEDVAERVRLVNGTAGVTCAETGFVEGQPCNLEDYTVLAERIAQANGEPLVGFDAYVELETDLNSSSAFRYYVVRLRTGAATYAAGTWEGIGSVTAELEEVADPQWRFCHIEGYDPVVYQQASQAMQGNPAHCDEGPVTDCTGRLLTGPIPLEDELIDDSDPYENSFRHHLRIAQDAAAYADELGQRLIETGLLMDRDAESAIRNLATVCGGEINADSLFPPDAMAGGVPTLENVVDGPCGTGCSPGYECTAGHCILDIVASAAVSGNDAVALAECLGGDDTLVPVVVLGDEALCLWSNDEAPNLLCSGATEDNPCPGRRVDGACPGIQVPTGNTEIGSADQALLGLFGARGPGGEELGTASTGTLDCNLIRDARGTVRGPARDALVRQIVQSNFFTIENVRHWAGRIGWRGWPLDYSEFTIDGGHWRGNGNPFPLYGGAAVPPEEWPCEPTGVTCTGGPTGLFCDIRDCNDRADRVLINDRMARAAIVLGVMSGYGLGNLWLPVRYGSTDSEVSVPPERYIGRGVIQDARMPVPSSWRIATGARWHALDLTGLVAIPLVPEDVWTRPAVSGQSEVTVASTLEWPTGFMNFGRAQRDPNQALRVTEAFWQGMSRGDGLRLADVGINRTSFADELLEVGDKGWFRLALAGGGSPRLLARDAASGGGYQRDLIDANLAFTTYWAEYPYAVNSADVGETFRNNIIHIAGDGFRRGDALDALELMCEAARAVEEEGPFCDPSRPPRIQSVADLPQLRAYMRCLASMIEDMGKRMVLQNVPNQVVASLRGDPGATALNEGTYGREIFELQDALRTLGSLPRSIAGQLSGFADDLEILETVLAEISASHELQTLSTVSNVLSQAAACASSNSANSAVATCANAAAQIVIAFRVNDLNQGILNDTQQRKLIEFRSSVRDRQEILAQLGEQILRASDDARSSLTQLQANRRAASRDLAGALFASSDAGNRHYHVNTAMRRQYNTLRERYLEARRAAVHYAILARRALEQRLGTDLQSLAIDRDLTLVDDPRDWVGSVCETTGIDYSRIRDETELEMESYASEFIGDYVRRLERTLESYRLDYPYTSAADTAVVSLRDDLRSVPEICPGPSYNLLAASGAIAQSTEPLPDGAVAVEELGDEVLAAWSAHGCSDIDESPTEELIEGCVSVVPVRANGLTVDAASRSSRVGAYRVTFAAGAPSIDPVSFTSNTDWGQTLPDSLGAGLYRLSWYGACVNDAVDRDPGTAVALAVANEDGPVALTTSEVLSTTTEPTGCTGAWTRFFRFVDLAEGGTGRVRILPGDPITATEHSVDIAAVQLEWVGDRIFESPTGISQGDADSDVALYYPRPFATTTSFATIGCTELNGDRFRRRWAYDCEPLCVAGLGQCGAEEEGTRYCYWETEINITLEAMEARELVAQAGFAHGNFNYRIDHLGLNFVGTNTRDCTSVDIPDTCYGSGFIPYSIEHRPPYAVRNYTGDTYHAPLFLGRVEHARGLAAERYVTNPLSSTDRSLVEPYMRTELRGRPFSGIFRLRVWDEPGVAFHNIEDVQLILDYRYLTRTPEATDR